MIIFCAIHSMWYELLGEEAFFLRLYNEFFCYPSFVYSALCSKNVSFVMPETNQSFAALYDMFTLAITCRFTAVIKLLSWSTVDFN